MNAFNLTSRISVRFVAVVTIFSMLLSAFPVAFFVAMAAETVYSAPANISVNNPTTSATPDISTVGYTNLKLSFNFNGQGLPNDAAAGIDQGDTFRFGWRAGAAGPLQELGTVAGKNNAHNSELGAFTNLALPAGAAGIANLQVYFKIDGGSSDMVAVSNLVVTGDAVVEEPQTTPSPYDGKVLDGQDQVEICHSAKGKNYVSNTPNVDAFINLLEEDDKNGHHSHEFDIIPPFKFLTNDDEGEYEGKNWNAETAEFWENDCKDADADYATVTLLKEVKNEDGADLDAFTLTLNGDAYTHNDEVSIEIEEGKELEVVVSETDIPAGYSLSGISCQENGVEDIVSISATQVELDLEAGDAYTCTITNEKDSDVELELIKICKYEPADAEGGKTPLAGWEMTLTNGKQGEDAQTYADLVTGEDGCVSQFVDVNNGPWTASEVMKPGYEQVSAVATNGNEVQMGDDFACEFFGLSIVDQAFAFASRIIDNEDPVFRCDFVNQKEVLQCVDELEGSWVDGIEIDAVNQGKKKDNSAITDANRIDPNVIVGASDWVPNTNDATGFFSLGFGGSVVVSFNSYVPNVVGTDLTVYEATNGNYPAETATVEVSQDGVNFVQAGVANNAAVPSRTTAIDFDSTGFAWIKYVRVTDTSNPSLHDAAADGFDLDAIKATQQVCKEPTKPAVCSVKIVSDTTNTVVEKAGAFAKLVTWFHDDWDAVVAAPSAWIWGDDPVVDPVNDTTQTFLKKFGWNGPVTNATLTIAADNSYGVTVNDTYFGGDATENNFGTADVHDLTSLIAQGNNELEIAVKNWAQTNGTVKTNPAGLKYELVIEGSDEDCDVPYVEPKEATIVAHKIVCTDEAQLPNWAAGGEAITETTATDWVKNNKSCSLVPNWEFQWGPQSAYDPGDTMVGEADAPWETFGPTDIDGKATVTISEDELEGSNNLWFREVLQEGYIPFTHDQNGQTNVDDFSAEVYCHTDVLNYDNYDRIDGVEVDETYYCVAWNHEAPEPLVCEPEVNLLANGSFEVPEVTDGANWDIFDLATYPALGWAVEFVSAFAGAPDVASLELHNGVYGWTSSEGVQHAELDSDWQGPEGGSGEEASVMISQTIPTIPGATYTLSWDFSPRPDTFQSENQLDVLVDGVVEKSNSAVGGNSIDWNSDSYTFEATGNTTEISFADDGTPNSVGTLLDNASLVCGNVAPTCSLEMVSDETTLVVTNNDFAVATYDGNEAWTASIPGATWIWDTEQVVDPEVETTRVFEETFTVNGATNAILNIAADNTYRIYINDELFADRTDINTNFQALGQKQFDITSELIDGENTIRFEVINRGLGGSNYLQNPAGLLFKITLDGESNCAVTTDRDDEDDGDNNDPETYVVDGYKWNDANGDGEWGEGELGLEDWTIYATNTEEDGDVLMTTTDEDGYYKFVLPAGEWEISEGDQPNWYQTAPEEPGTCTFNLGKPVFFDTRFSILEVVALPLTVQEGECDFGNQFRDSNDEDPEPEVSGRSSGGGSPSPRCELDYTRDGNEVTLSWETRNANEIVLEANGEEIFASDNDDIVDEGEFEVTLTEDTEYEMTVSRGSRDNTCSVDVSLDGPEGRVLGEQVSVVPLGAADAGAGGTAPVAAPALSAMVAAFLVRTRNNG